MQLTVTKNYGLTSNVYFMQLTGDTRQITKPGQFVQLQLPTFYLRRPISVCDYVQGENGTLDLIYKVVGKGTEYMATLPVGFSLDVLMGLGNGYDVSADCQTPVLVGGGVGVPPLYALAKALLKAGKIPSVVLGFNTKEEVFYKEAFEALGVPVTVTTVDGTEGLKGYVTNALPKINYDYAFSCGPEPMLKALYNVASEHKVSGQYSFEERMACGFGACMGCSCKTKYGAKRICKDGPILLAEEIIW